MEKTLYQGKFIKVNEVKIDNYTWEKVYLPHSLVVIALTKNKEIIFIEEKRPHEKNPTRLKLVTGHIDKGESVLECANRELQEEAGFKAKKLKEILLHESTGTVNSNFHYILAEDLEESKLPNPDGEDTIIEVLKIKVEDVKRMIYEDKLPWNLSTLGLFKVFHLLE